MACTRAGHLNGVRENPLIKDTLLLCGQDTFLFSKPFYKFDISVPSGGWGVGAGGIRNPWARKLLRFFLKEKPKMLILNATFQQHLGARSSQNPCLVPCVILGARPSQTLVPALPSWHMGQEHSSTRRHIANQQLGCVLCRAEPVC